MLLVYHLADLRLNDCGQVVSGRTVCDNVEHKELCRFSVDFTVQDNSRRFMFYAEHGRSVAVSSDLELAAVTFKTNTCTYKRTHVYFNRDEINTTTNNISK